MLQVSGHQYERGPPLDTWPGGLEFLPSHFYLFHKADEKLDFFTP